jgi:hypothetical protein
MSWQKDLKKQQPPLEDGNLILESYRFDSETLNLEISLVNLSSLVDDCFEKLKPLSDQKILFF